MSDLIRGIQADVHSDAETFSLLVHRSRVLKSTLIGIKKADFFFNQPLRVIFSGEEAVDEGGPRREFF